MADKWEVKKESLYKASARKPEIVTVPSMLYLTVSGTGNPNGEAFGQAVEALYKFSYTLKMRPKKGTVPTGYFEYAVPPLEGHWDVADHEAWAKGDKNALAWTIMIRQPSFLSPILFSEIREKLTSDKKTTNPRLADLRLETLTDGLSCQMLHVGSFDDEPATFALMENFISESGYVRAALTHREIYLSDFRRTAPEKLKTILRFAVEQQ